MKKTFVLILLAMSNYSIAQDLYAFKGFSLYKVDESDTVTTLFTLDENSELGFNDIAYLSDTLFYGVTSENYIYEIIPSSFTFNIIGSFEGSEYPFGFSSLVCDGQNLYSLNGIDGTLYKFDLTTNTSSVIADLGYTTPGDCTFFKGHLIFLASEEYTIKAYNMTTGILLDLACIPESYVEGYGITNLFTSCDEEKVIISFGRKLYEIDFENNQLMESPLILPNNFSILGLASSNEHVAFNCNNELEQNSCALSVAEYNFLNFKPVYYPNPTQGKIHLNENFKFDSITIKDMRGVSVRFYSHQHEEIDLDNLQSGVYFVCFKFGDKERIEKLIKI